MRTFTGHQKKKLNASYLMVQLTIQDDQGFKVKTVLFICSGNVFRSVTAQLALSREVDNMGRQDELRCESAGTHTESAVMRWDLVKIWQDFGFFVVDHTPTQVTGELLARSDVTIAMGFDHQEFIWRKFQRQSYLFNQLAYGKNKSVLDLPEAVEDHEYNSDAATRYMAYTVQYIISATPNLLENLDKDQK